MPVVQQFSFSLEREMAGKFVVTASYMHVHGKHLIRARDMNLPKPVVISYPVCDESGLKFLGTYYNVESFSGWENANSLTCPFPPCIAPLDRPISQIGAINAFETAATSIYDGATLSITRRMGRRLHFRVGYTWGRAVDDGQDALVAGCPATVQNSYSPNSEHALSSIDQRQRLVASFSWEPRLFIRDQQFLRVLLNGWKASSLISYGSGRPVNAQIAGDANHDGNDSNDRLPGYKRNAFTGPDYMTTDMRIARTFRLSERIRL